jgi:hypothetical protein
MKKVFLFIGNIMSIGFFLFISGCDRSEKVSEIEFDYYPEKNIYFNVARSTFIYSIDGAKSWDSLHTSSKEEQKLLGRKEKIYTKTPEVWKENKTHLSMYEGKIMQMISEVDRNSVTSDEEVSDKRTIAKNSGTAVPKKAVAPKKKGIKGFFDKVFGKKKKKE